jgi:hypothetical protein
MKKENQKFDCMSVDFNDMTEKQVLLYEINKLSNIALKVKDGDSITFNMVHEVKKLQNLFNSLV